MNWRLGLSAASDLKESASTSFSGKFGKFHSKTSRDYPVLIVARSILMADALNDEFGTNSTNKRRSFRPLKPPITVDVWKACFDKMNCLLQYLNSNMELPGWSLGRELRGRNYLIIDWLPALFGIYGGDSLFGINCEFKLFRCIICYLINLKLFEFVY